MRKIINWFISNFVCKIKGHVPEYFLYENDIAIYSKRCKRCKSIIRTKFYLKANRNNAFITKQWIQFYDETEEKVRKYILEKMYPPRKILTEKTKPWINYRLDNPSQILD